MVELKTAFTCFFSWHPEDMGVGGDGLGLRFNVPGWGRFSWAEVVGWGFGFRVQGSRVNGLWVYGFMAQWFKVQWFNGLRVYGSMVQGSMVYGFMVQWFKVQSSKFEGSICRVGRCAGLEEVRTPKSRGRALSFQGWRKFGPRAKLGGRARPVQ